jgi:hypothetical protein
VYQLVKKFNDQKLVKISRIFFPIGQVGLKHSKVPESILANNLFQKKLYETPKKNIPNFL